MNTDFGTFRLSGEWNNTNFEAPVFTFESIEIMDTDGWVLLDQSKDQVSVMVEKLIPYLLVHLRLT
jgi:hypothetical protein